MQLTQGVRRNRQLHRDRTATIYGDRQQTWGEFADRVARLGGGLAALGVHPGDRVAIMALNSDRFVEAFYATLWAGAIAVPLNTRWARAEIDHAVADSRPAAIFYDSDFAVQAARLAESGVRLIAMEDDVDGLQQLIKQSTPIDDMSAEGDEPAAIFYTGGTTGFSKGVMLSHANILTNFLLMQAVAPYPADTVFLHAAPMFHLADASCLIGLTALGATHVILPGFEPDATLDSIERHRISALLLVPTMIGMTCERLRTRIADVSSVRRLYYGASPISAALLERAMTVFPNAQFFQGYGQTELSPGATMLLHDDHLAGKLQSAGRPLPSIDLRVADENLEDVELGTVGEILVRGPCVMKGYWNQEALTRETIVNGWLRTGDAGYMDREGYLYVVDRVKDMVVSGGENIYSGEVENALLRHPDVIQCAVIGVPDERWGEKVHAVVYLRPGSKVTAEALLAHCEPLIANYKRPKSFDLSAMPLPLSGVGKVLKSELRKPFWAAQSRSVG